ncbi:MAG TPA: BamA/TamA family outer membrane protein, partial [Longimicrobium sp.]
RLVNKDQTRGQHRDIQDTFVGDVIQDQVSSLHPAAALVAVPLLDAAGVLHIPSRLYALPRTGLPAEHAAFAGMLGVLEERPRAGNSEVPGIAAAAAVEDTEDFLEALESSPSHRLDTRDYLAGRLMDIYFGDWDRHEDQYSWARHDRGGERLWRAIPRDRDYVFADYDGLLLDLARGQLPKAVRFVEDYEGQLFGLTQNAQLLDRRLLGDLDRAAWQSVASGLQSRLSDPVIEAAVGRLPAEYRVQQGDSLRSMLRARRQRLGEVAMTWYGWLAAEPEVYARDVADLAVVEHAADGSAEVRIHAGGEGAAPYFRRRFVPGDTREIRLFLRGGPDRAVVRGGPGRITTRVIGGGGDDVLADSSRGARVRFYDDRGENRFVRGARTRVDTREYTPPAYERGAGVSPPRDWGRNSALFTPDATWRSRVGVVVGGGPSFKSYGFRRFPYATSGHLRALWAPLHTRFGVEYHGEYHFTGSRRWLETEVRATQLALTDFHGFGNETAEIEEGGVKHVWEKQFLVQPTWYFPLSRRTWLTLAPVARWTDPEPDAESPARLESVRGSRSWGALGARTGLLLDRVDDPGFPRLGFALAADASAFPAAARLDGPFGSAGALGRAYLGGRVGPVLALRGGVRAAWGDFPLQEAAFIGGGGSLRGFGGQRFAGDRAVHGSAEIRQPLFRANLGVRGTLGAFGLADAGRVYVDGDSPGGWHTAAGGGLFFHFLDRTVSVAYAHGESGRVYFDMGLPF